MNINRRPGAFAALVSTLKVLAIHRLSRKFWSLIMLRQSKSVQKNLSFLHSIIHSFTQLILNFIPVMEVHARRWCTCTVYLGLTLSSLSWKHAWLHKCEMINHFRPARDPKTGKPPLKCFAFPTAPAAHWRCRKAKLPTPPSSPGSAVDR